MSGNLATRNKRAIEAGLQMHEMASLLTAHDIFASFVDTRLKVSICKVNMALGRIGYEPSMPIGSGPSLLKRLLEHAKPGDTIVTDPVIEGLRDSYNVEELRDIKLKGFDGTRHIYRVARK
jgi:class 3 adenylate cyclase